MEKSSKVHSTSGERWLFHLTQPQKLAIRHEILVTTCWSLFDVIMTIILTSLSIQASTKYNTFDPPPTTNLSTVRSGTIVGTNSWIASNARFPAWNVKHAELISHPFCNWWTSALDLDIENITLNVIRWNSISNEMFLDFNPSIQIMVFLIYAPFERQGWNYIEVYPKDRLLQLSPVLMRSYLGHRQTKDDFRLLLVVVEVSIPSPSDQGVLTSEPAAWIVLLTTRRISL